MPEPYKADVVAAERLLKAAVRRAVDMIREGYEHPRRYILGVDINRPLEFIPGAVFDMGPAGPDPVVAMLTEAGNAADLLLSERAS